MALFTKTCYFIGHHSSTIQATWVNICCLYDYLDLDSVHCAVFLKYGSEKI